MDSLHRSRQTGAPGASCGRRESGPNLVRCRHRPGQGFATAEDSPTRYHVFMSLKPVSIALGCILVVFSSAALAFHTWFADNQAAEQFLCRYFYLCANERLVEWAQEHSWRGGQSPWNGPYRRTKNCFDATQPRLSAGLT